MLFILFAILAITLLIMVFIGIMFNTYSDIIGGTTYGIATLTVCIITFVTAVFTTIESRNPTAIDVYRGNTTLEVTYKNGVAIDSTVVFK